MTVIETSRLILRHLTWNDLDNLAALYADPQVMTFLGGTRTYEGTKQQLDWIFDSYEKHGFGLWATLHKADNQFIGRCGLIALEIDDQPEIEIGYALHQKYWGQGLATEAARAIRDYGCLELGFNRLISLVDHDNIASQKVAIKNGLTYEKNITKWDKNLRVYVIHKADFLAQDSKKGK